MPRPDHIRLLLKKASQDEYVLDKMTDDGQAPIEIFGFHAQQAAEKMLKAVLAQAKVEYPRTHRLAELIDLAKDNGIDLPDKLEDVRLLTPFAVEFRYDVFPGASDEGLDKKHVREQLRQLRCWVESKIRTKKTGRSTHRRGLKTANS